MRAGPALLAALLAACLTLRAAGGAEPDPNADLREFSVGMPLSALPAHGYADLACVLPPDGGARLGGWGDYRRCPPDASGRREIAFRYDDDAEHATKVAGQPVLLQATLAEDGALEALRIETDPAARLYQRKAGFAFALRVKARYGEAGWACEQSPPADGQEPVGEIFVDEHCEKTLGQRHLALDRQLFRLKGQDARQFTSRTVFTVSLASGS